MLQKQSLKNFSVEQCRRRNIMKEVANEDWKDIGDTIILL